MNLLIILLVLAVLNNAIMAAALEKPLNLGSVVFLVVGQALAFCLIIILVMVPQIEGLTHL